MHLDSWITKKLDRKMCTGAEKKIHHLQIFCTEFYHKYLELLSALYTFFPLIFSEETALNFKFVHLCLKISIPFENGSRTFSSVPKVNDIASCFLL